MNKSNLYIVPTPIGNLSDITIRAIDVLRISDLIIAEDTRVTKKLLDYYQINTRLISYHKFNEKKRLDYILELLKKNKIISLVSNAGTPLLSDPGFVIVRAAIDQGVKIEALPGPSAILSSVLLSGFNPEKFIFFGFLDRKDSTRLKQIKEIGKMPFPVIIFEAPTRIIKLLKEMLQIIGNRQIAIIKELTKIHENVFRGKISEIFNYLNVENLKGEFVLVIGPYEETMNIKTDEINSKINYYLRIGKTKKEIVGIISNEFGLKRNEAYKYIHSKMEV